MLTKLNTFPIRFLKNLQNQMGVITGKLDEYGIKIY